MLLTVGNIKIELICHLYIRTFLEHSHKFRNVREFQSGFILQSLPLGDISASVDFLVKFPAHASKLFSPVSFSKSDCKYFIVVYISERAFVTGVPVLKTTPLLFVFHQGTDISCTDPEFSEHRHWLKDLIHSPFLWKHKDF